MKEKRRNRKLVLCRITGRMAIFVLGLWMTGPGICAKGAEPITVTRQLDREEAQGWKEPEALYRDEEGREYRLSHWEIKELPGDRVRRSLERTVVYRAVEEAEILPESIPVEEESGLEAEGELSAGERRILREEWEEGFVAPVVFHSYGAGEYQLGDVVIGGEMPLEEAASHGAELLRVLGLPQEAYRITAMVWDGEPYEDADAGLCRRALATGQKRLRDYEIVYKGDIWVQEPAAYELKLEYEPLEQGKEEPEALEENRKAAAEPEKGEEEELGILQYWVRSGFVIAVAAGLLGIATGLVLLLVLWTGQRRRRRERQLPCRK